MSTDRAKNAVRGRIGDSVCARKGLLLALALMTVACSSQPTIPVAERRLTREEFGDNWPFTSPEGVVACDLLRSIGSAVVFTTGGVTYGVNDTATSLGYPAIDPLRRSNLSPGRPRKVTVERVPESVRRTIFAAGVACAIRAGANAERRHPRLDRRGRRFVPQYLDPLLFPRMHLERRLLERCLGPLRRRHRLSDRELDLIAHEGNHYGWPPLRPVRVSIAPIIGIGLELCRVGPAEHGCTNCVIW